LEWFTLKIRSFPVQLFAGLLLAVVAFSLTACNTHVIYHIPTSNYSGRPIPPSKLLQRVMAAYTVNGSQGGIEILDGLRDLRGNVENTVPEFFIKGYSEPDPISIINFPEQTTGYVLNYTDGTLSTVNYSTEAATGTAATFAPAIPSVAAAPGGILFAGAVESAGILGIAGEYGSVSLNLPNVDKVVVNPSATIVLAMVRNSNQLYRVVKLPATGTPTYPPGYIDCQPLLLPTYCVVPVANTASGTGGASVYDRPTDAVFSSDGTSVYVLNCGPECGGTTAGVTVLQQGPLLMQDVPTVNPLTQPAPLATLPVANPIAVPGGVTAGLTNGSTLYLAGQQLQSTGANKGLFAGNLSLLNLATYTVGSPISISDGNHSRMLFGDSNTLWIGSSNCANGVRAATATAELASQGFTDQAGNYNCLTMVNLGTATPTATIIPKVVQSNVSSVQPVTVPYPNTNLNPYYYGSLTGICWVQNYYKVYTAYGGQIHAFYTGVNPTPDTGPDASYENGGTPGLEINNQNITIQGTVLDVAYMDAESNSAN
jgi:hypothetical protein